MLKTQELTLSVVTEVLRDIFGYASFIAMNFIREVRAVTNEKECPTLSIDPHGLLRYNPTFFAKYVNTERKLQEVLFHEMLHPVLGDMHRRNSYIANLASDMIINVLVGKTLGHCDLMEEFYPNQVLDPENSVGGLLRPRTLIKPDGKKFANIYEKLWHWWDSVTGVYDPNTGGMRLQDHDFSSIEELREIMEILLSRHQGKTVVLIGSHGHTVNDMGGRDDPMLPTIPVDVGGNYDEISGELRERLADELSDVLSKSAGHGDDLMEMAIKAIKANVTLVRKLLEDFSAAAEFNSFKNYIKSTKSRRMVFPKRLSRRDAVMLGAGIDPLFYQSPRTFMTPKKDGMSVFVDVSGSQYAELPMILGFLKATQGFTEGIYQFSNKVAKTTMKQLFKGDSARIDTTGGTDYNCIVEYACEHDLRKIVVITDGYAGLTEENKKKALVQIQKACVIYSESHTRDEFWRKHFHRDYSIHDLFKAC